MSLRHLLISLILCGFASLVLAQENSPAPLLYCENSPFNTPLEDNLDYEPEPRISSFRPNQAQWSIPLYRLDADTPRPAPVTIINDYSGREEQWPIPTDAQPAAAEDRHLGIIDYATGRTYELWDARWQPDGTLQAGGMVSFPLDGPGISPNPDQRVTASGFAVTAGMLTLEDLRAGLPPSHALSMSLNFDLIDPQGMIYPAVGVEAQGLADEDGLPMGVRLALPPDLPADALEDLHPLTRLMAAAARDYGIYVNDTNGAPKYKDGYVGNVRVEPGAIEAIYDEDSEDLLWQVQAEMNTVIEAHGIFRVPPPDEEATTCE